MLVGRVVLLVHHDEAQAGEGRKDCGAGPHRHRSLARGQAPPLVEALAVAQAAVQQGHPFPEAPAELQGHGVGEGDLGEEHQDLPSLVQGFPGRGQVHLGFAAGGHAVEEKRRKIFTPDTLHHSLNGLFLIRDQGQGGLPQGVGLIFEGVGEGPPLFPGNETLLHQAFQNGGTGGENFAQIPDRHGIPGLAKIVQDFPGPWSLPLGGWLLYGLGGYGYPGLPFGAGGPGAAGDKMAQGLSQGILVIVRHPAPQRHELRPEAGQGVQDGQDLTDGGMGNLPARAQDISGHLAPPHRHLHQAAHPGLVLQSGGQPVGQGLEEGEGYRHFPKVS